MTEKKLYVAALFAAFMTTVHHSQGGCNGGRPTANLYINDFLKTGKTIWTYNSTAHMSPTCKVDVIQYVNGRNVAFARIYIQNNFTVRQNLTANIPSGQMDSIYFTAQGNHCYQEQIIYLGEIGDCALIRVTQHTSCGQSRTSGLSDYVELRVYNSSIAAGPDCGCRSKFATYSSRGHRVYNADCQKILEPGCRQQTCYSG
uniref:Lipocalin n=1 Tax=Rhipicephalus zambeziensis TaxID=60191 RepID=A0A224YC53_9ACAR